MNYSYSDEDGNRVSGLSDYPTDSTYVPETISEYPANYYTKKQFKTRQVLSALLAGEHLSGFDMLDRFGLYRASGVIHYLRGMGYNIKTKLVPNDDGGIYGIYYIPNPAKPTQEK